MFSSIIRRNFFLGLLLLPPLFLSAQSDKVITIVGTGYVGLVSGACLAEIGNSVICTDVDTKKIELLRDYIMPIYELGLEDLVERNVEAGRLMFTDDVSQAIEMGDIIFIAVGTPMGEDGNADLSYINAVIKTIADSLNSYKIIVTKSTVPVGTGKKIRAQLEENYGIDPSLFSIVSNPEFLREGLAVNDFLYPDRLIIGTDSDSALIALCEIYETLITGGTPYVLTDVQTAEMIKYASNAFLSVKISYINEVANLCDATDADVKTVAYAMGLDHRISPAFLNPGPGFGGSCFPKDSQAIVYIAREHNLPFHTVQAALDANVVQQGKPVEKLQALVQRELHEDLAGKTIAVLGLAFKANTDDVRYSPSIKTIELLLEQGAIVRAYDPIAMNNMSKIFPGLMYCTSPYEAATTADAVVIMTDWDEIKQIDFVRLKKVMRNAIIVDARNIVNPETLKQLGYACDAIGQSYLCKKRNEYLRKLVPIHLRKRVPSSRFPGKRDH
ncbi:MAG TPA: UDP-glucose/GDP-mannose dehydrogenase family protein [Candidatus Babeliales bacterium]|nr:UDP-glucose/GDP-mannose dehydrogenase family protein [Candidatus Babeliales bacterium]